MSAKFLTAKTADVCLSPSAPKALRLLVCGLRDRS
jgi:hypothetical protein